VSLESEELKKRRECGRIMVIDCGVFEDRFSDWNYNEARRDRKIIDGLKSWFLF
jgi:hypothetical protein